LIVASDVAFDLVERRLVLFGLHHRKQLGRFRQTGADLVEFGDRRFEPGALATERLGPVRGIPDRRVAELVIQLLEPLTLLVVLKDTP
jgi:hypothetical protein